MQRPMTPEQVATSWGCSANHVRRLINSGELRAFRLGERLFRIPADAVAEYEAAAMIEAVPPPAPQVSAQLPDGIVVIKHSRERPKRGS